MTVWKKVLVPSSASIREAVKIIDETSMQIVLVVDEGERLLGTITDGDVRRGILKGVSLEDSVERIMNREPTTATVDEGRDRIFATMQTRQLHQIPVVDGAGHVVGLETLNALIKPQMKENWVVLMAGGLGSRLRPLTDDCPKPMLKVGNKPLLENIVDTFVEYGFHRFYISVNYMADVVKSHFGDGERWNAEIQYLEEDRKLGTAGALSLLPGRPSTPLVVMNGDVVTKVNLDQLLDFHTSNRSRATMCVREYNFQVPYGVVKLDNHRITGIDEKPVQRMFVNAGIYVLEPETLDLVPSSVAFDMPALFERLIEAKQETAVFPLREHWLDIGELSDYRRANGEVA